MGILQIEQNSTQIRHTCLEINNKLFLTDQHPQWHKPEPSILKKLPCYVHKPLMGLALWPFCNKHKQKIILRNWQIIWQSLISLYFISIN